MSAILYLKSNRSSLDKLCIAVRAGDVSVRVSRLAYLTTRAEQAVLQLGTLMSEGHTVVLACELNGVVITELSNDSP